ncbi:MotA/TolQ/ExbB proton channel family protein [Mesorhizobium sp. ESP-6-4]|uniref:MotA/TolQ/ExbB proton channel family protein n=1 Tax=unclassified Mesorhizobium TaxID=325217 RepID=UPI000BB0BB92|nr:MULTISPECIES: MotA/TolQ/ExbB proton channel family protein [unclassified Mesorhizobium]MBZ9659066.1 MotA/TolQ/ExbB proton channel family protein [Mesorhizobium sp. ESP-6-4]MBZ9735884.1 MotA/TolQ/ExbB proton channel family protein [Mesorhizobium sp. CA9]MBZ9767639.1 MotA/TolQ/ExbB proton channel family protein [Mesorhizobium sp. CA6]MBZ9815559.1 MotA/TolQ/ExbB proton channel family protein [Mesorhizobium sp. CA7]MBZ9826765.1 MotA/TolQ/ExbB proton channel family protein [Mesorhizobium sp. CA1
MAFLRSFGRRSDVLVYDPHKLSSPQVFLLTMVIFLIIVAFIAAILTRQISTAFSSNPGLNGLIVGVLAVGILLAFAQVGRLFREVRWVNSFRAGSETTEPVLLAPMKAMIGRSSTIAFSTSSMRTMLDSIATRLDESRDTSRYLVGLLVFLGLLGTFWGLLNTIASIRETIEALDPGTGDAAAVLDALKQGLSAPLAGMGTAFSSSLFGLSGSLVLGFLDLQAGRAQTRFYTELENWLSSVTDLSSDIVVSETSKAAESSEDIRLLSERLRSLQENGGGSNPRVATAMANLADGISGLVKNMRSEQQIMRDWVEAQSDEQKAMRNTLEKIADALKKQGVH